MLLRKDYFALFSYGKRLFSGYQNIQEEKQVGEIAEEEWKEKVVGKTTEERHEKKQPSLALQGGFE